MTSPNVSINNNLDGKQFGQFDDPEQFARTERRARRFWVSLIVGFLGIQVVIGMCALYLALGDPSVAIIPNYHQSALDWDIKQRSKQLLRELGWEVSASVSPISSEQRNVIIQVMSEAGGPVENLHVEAKVFHHARGQEIYQALLREETPGLYMTTLALTRPGLWQIDLAIEGDHGIASQIIELEVE